MYTVVTIAVEHETDDMDVEVRLEGEVEVSSSAAEDSLISAVMHFLDAIRYAKSGWQIY